MIPVPQAGLLPRNLTQVYIQCTNYHSMVLKSFRNQSSRSRNSDPYLRRLSRSSPISISPSPKPIFYPESYTSREIQCPNYHLWPSDRSETKTAATRLTPAPPICVAFPSRALIIAVPQQQYRRGREQRESENREFPKFSVPYFAGFIECAQVQEMVNTDMSSPGPRPHT